MSKFRQPSEQSRQYLVDSESTWDGRARANQRCRPNAAGDETNSRLQGANVTDMPITKLNKLKIQVGFIGLGLMGSRLTRRLHSTGWNIQAWNRSSGPAD